MTAREHRLRARVDQLLDEREQLRAERDRYQRLWQAACVARNTYRARFHDLRRRRTLRAELHLIRTKNTTGAVRNT